MPVLNINSHFGPVIKLTWLLMYFLYICKWGPVVLADLGARICGSCLWQGSLLFFGYVLRIQTYVRLYYFVGICPEFIPKYVWFCIGLCDGCFAYECAFIILLFLSLCKFLTLGQRLIIVWRGFMPQSHGTQWGALKVHKTYFVLVVCVEERELEELMVLAVWRAHVKTGLEYDARALDDASVILIYFCRVCGAGNHDPIIVLLQVHHHLIIRYLTNHENYV